MRLTIRPTIRRDRPARYVVYSPDDLPIRPRPFPSRVAAERALAAWCGRFTLQGYYKACAGRLSLEELPARCRIVAVPPTGAAPACHCAMNADGSAELPWDADCPVHGGPAAHHCSRCGQAVTPDGQGAWIDATEGDCCPEDNDPHDGGRRP